VLAAALHIAAAAAVRLPPVEQCAGDPEFDLVRAELGRAVEAKDIDGLLSLMSTDVRVTFGGRFGRESFRHYWASNSSDSGELWRELRAALDLGCAAATDGKGVAYRAMPSMFITGGELDGFTTWVAMPGAGLRRRPAPGAAVTMRLPAWTVLEEVQHDGGSWLQVRTPKGRRGYVSTAEARSLIDYRIVFGRRDGRWRITAFVAGD